MRWPDEAPAFQEKSWRLQRYFALAVAAVLALSLTGFFGGAGGGASAVARTETGTIEYPKYWRRTVPERIEFRFAAPVQEVWLTADLEAKGEIQQVDPAPASIRTDGERVYYRFPTAVPRVTFSLKPQVWGRFAGRVGQADESVELRMWIHP